MKQILSAVQHGEEVVVYSRNRAIAKIVPIKISDTIKEDYGFGMWRDDVTTKDVDQYVRKLRKGRVHDL